MLPCWPVALPLPLNAAATSAASTSDAQTPQVGALRPCRECRGPEWSWDVFPAFFHGSDPNGTAGGGFTEAALATITRFPIVTLEKWQGMDLTPYTWQEDAWVTAARQIKQRNPAATVLVWFDTVHIYEQDETLDPELEDHPGAWETGCTSGNFRKIAILSRFACHPSR